MELNKKSQQPRYLLLTLRRIQRKRLKQAFTSIFSHFIDFKKLEQQIATKGIKSLELNSQYEIVPRKKLLISRVLTRLTQASLSTAFHLWQH